MKLPVLLLLLMQCAPVLAQHALRISIEKPGGPRIYEILPGESFTYKLENQKGKLSARLAAVNDSMIICANDSTVQFRKLRYLRFHKNNHFLQTLKNFFLIGGTGFIILNTANQLIIDDKPVIQYQALLVSGGLLSCAALMARLEIVKIRMRPAVQLKPVTLKYNDL